MTRIVMLDLGDTLVRENKVLAHVPVALEAIGGLQAGDGNPIATCLVSDWLLANSPGEVESLVSQFLELLDGFGLRDFFEPVGERVTLNTHVGISKPDRRVFETALQRLGSQASLEECLFITENPRHISACKALGMQTLQFGIENDEGVDFSDWSDGPRLVAQLIDSDEDANRESVLRAELAAEGIAMQSLSTVPQAKTLRGQADIWQRLSDPKLAELDGIQVRLPAEIVVELDDDGKIAKVATSAPTPEIQQEAVDFVAALKSNDQIATTKRDTSPLGKSHALETDEQGRRFLKRKRFRR